jgi:hypothetical protein
MLYTKTPRQSLGVFVYILRFLRKILYTIYMKKITILGSSFFLLPLITFAQFKEVDTFFNNISTFINNVLVPLVFAFALLFFVYGMFRYFILGGASDENREKGRSVMWWSIIGFVLMVSIWGIVNIIAGGIFGNTAPPKTPTGPGFKGSLQTEQVPLAIFENTIVIHS